MTAIADDLTAHVLTTIRQASANAPRSLQRAVGPSEVGVPCDRRLAYKLAGWPQANGDRDTWLATIGTSVHAHLAGIFEAENARLRQDWLSDYDTLAGWKPRYLIEHRVSVPASGRIDGISGSCDLFDRETCTVMDWKLSSPRRISDYRRKGPGAQYEIQAQIYGLGMQLAGEYVEHVADVFLPRGGKLADLYVWSAPYQPQIAIDALTRYDRIRDAVWQLDPEKHPERWSLIPTADSFCTFCPYFLPYSADLSKGCPGHATVPPAESSVDSLIAPGAS